jgi:glyoxylase-like metal-dependent hydrolase (beta-lactamase superfamily II)
MAAPDPLDLLHLGNERVIAAYLLRTEDGPALFDCGPASCVDALRAALAARGLRVADLRHLLLSHIHLDHAGAAGVLVREHPGLQVHVSEIGAPHLLDPSRLERSARRLYGDAFDALWGELAPVPEENLHVAAERVAGLDCFPTPGHASHHGCYLDGEGTLYAGDAAGVRILPSSYVFPPTPPPELDVDAWLAIIDELERRAPERLALIHFGVAEDVGAHLDRLRSKLLEWSRLVEGGASQEEFAAAGHAGMAPEDAALYEQAMPLEQSYAGLRRWADKRTAAAAEAG